MARIHSCKYPVSRFVINSLLIIGMLIGPNITIVYSSGNNLEETTGSISYLPIISSGDVSWSMLGANPERTSWVPEEVPGKLKPLWYKQFEAYIPPKVQIITAYSTLYISTASGLYALDAETGVEKWVYPTELPLGHSPTVYKGVVYVGGFDKMLHAINAFTGQRLWTFTAGAGFDTNPLVVDELAMLGNRDGYFYAIHIQGPETGQLAWRYQTEGSIDYSAAYNGGVVYFASQDSYAYALQVQTGSLVWKSEKLPGAGFQAWWPVVYKDWVIFSGSNNYRSGVRPGPDSQIFGMELYDLFPNHVRDPRGTLVGPLGTEPGDWAQNTPTINASESEITPNGSTTPITEYFEQKPWRRSYFVLNKNTGDEYTTDFDGDGKPEYAPILWQGTYSGNRYPPVVGIDNVLYQSNNYMSDQWIPGGQVSGWKLGSPFISIVSSDWNAVDEPQAYSAGGNLIYWNLCCDRESGAYNISTPNTPYYDKYQAGGRPATGSYDYNREWKYFDYNLNQLIPGYSMYSNGGENNIYLSFGGDNGEYGLHGLQNPPIPYQGKVYMHRGNSVIAFDPYANNPIQLPMAEIVPYQDPNIHIPSVDDLKSLLAQEVQKIIDAGHLRPGYFSSGAVNFALGRREGSDFLLDYWHTPSESLIVLLEARPYLSPNLQSQLDSYLQAEFTNFPPYIYNHIGWVDGVAREPYILPPEVSSDMATMPPELQRWDYIGWTRNPILFYALWKYAEVFGGAVDLYNASAGILDAVPSDTYLYEYPYVHNAFIAGYLGFLELEAMAGHAETVSVRNEYNRLLVLRASTFTKDIPADWLTSTHYERTLSISRNFIFLVPELGQYLHDNAYTLVSQALAEYTYTAPYWLQAKYEATFGEGAINHFYDYSSIFAGKAMILQEPYQELTKYIDVPATSIGDLFFIQNLVLAIEAGSR